MIREKKTKKKRKKKRAKQQEKCTDQDRQEACSGVKPG
jgi:hypothetical protein